MRSTSQAGQDLFAFRVLKNKTGGTYLDIGCGDSIAFGSNTLALSEVGWTGIGIDVESAYRWGWEHLRKTKFILNDITTLNWNKVIEENPYLTDTVDYLSFDVDDATIGGVENFPWDKIRFRVITIEHDSYRVGDDTKIFLRHILSKHGYYLLCADVMVEFPTYVSFEDWWVDPRKVDMDRALEFKSDSEPGVRIPEKGRQI